MAVDRKQIIDTVLYGYGNEETTPLPDYQLQLSSTTPQNSSSTAEIAEAYFAKNGWKANSDGILQKKNGKTTETLSFTLTTSNNPELSAVATLLQSQWKAIGADVTVSVVDVSELNQTVIRPRKYDALLFGEITGRENDLYPFWHSSERKDPGLNIALYTNSNADKLLEKARAATSTDQISTSLRAFEDIVSKDTPAIFLYSPKMAYVVPKELKGLSEPALEMPYERWIGLFNSFIETKRVFK
jgi:peptide/nickel transport system substrate-binding protein